MKLSRPVMMKVVTNSRDINEIKQTEHNDRQGWKGKQRAMDKS